LPHHLPLRDIAINQATHEAVAVADKTDERSGPTRLDSSGGVYKCNLRLARFFTGRSDAHGNTWGRPAPGVQPEEWKPPLPLKGKFGPR